MSPNARSTVPLRTCAFAFFAIGLFGVGCGFTGGIGGSDSDLLEVAASSSQWTGVAVAGDGQLFVNFPRWSDDVPVSVAALNSEGELVPYPSESWNDWSGTDPAKHFVCVQSVHVDRGGRLWILDAANPKFAGVVAGGPKLVEVDLQKDEVVRVISFGESIAPADSYLNDIRVDVARDHAYISDSGTGAIIWVDLKSGESRRMLHESKKTKSEGITVEVGGVPFRLPDGSHPDVHVDGIALNANAEHLYFQALTGRTLYRVETRYLRQELAEGELDFRVEKVAKIDPSDGIEFGLDGHLYMTAIEDNAIRRYTREGELQTVVKDDQLNWPDSFALATDGSLYVTTAQVHLWGEVTEPYRVFRVETR